MMNYIEENHPEDKEWFKGEALVFNEEKGKNEYMHLRAVRAFCERYMQNLLPKANKRINKSEKLMNW